MNQRDELANRKDWQLELYQRYHQKVFSICLYFLKDREEAKDASHDVFLKVFRAWQSFEWKCDPMTWIGAIAKYDCFSRLHKHKKRLDCREQIAHEEELRSAPEPEGDLVLQRMRLEKHMPLVRGKLREILRLNMEGLNHREIAVRMGVSRVAITRRLTRFKKALLSAGAAQEAVAAKAIRPGLAAAAANGGPVGNAALALKGVEPARRQQPESALQETGIRLRAA